MPSQKPSRPPAHDAKAANTAWSTLPKAGGQPYEVFASGSYVDFTSWTRKLRDVVNANAVYLDDVAGDAAKANAKTIDLDSRVAALEEAPQARPFP